MSANSSWDVVRWLWMLWDVLSISAVPKDHNIPTSTGWEAMASLTARRVWLSTPLSPGAELSAAVCWSLPHCGHAAKQASRRQNMRQNMTKIDQSSLCCTSFRSRWCLLLPWSPSLLRFFQSRPLVVTFPPSKKKPSVYHTRSTSPSREVHRPGCTNSLGMQQIISWCMPAKWTWLVPTEDPTTILCGVWNDLVHLVKFPRMLSFCLNLRIETVGKVRANSSSAAFLRWCWQWEAFRARIHSRHSQASCQPELLSNCHSNWTANRYIYNL